MKLVIAIVLLAFPLVAFSQSSRNDINSSVDNIAVDPYEIADSVVTFVPALDMALNIPLSKDMLLQGDITSVEKGVAPTGIIKRANTMTLPLAKGVPVKIYLKRHRDLDAYYPIAIFPVNAGEKK